MSILSALRETNANNGRLIDTCPKLPEVSYRRLKVEAVAKRTLGNKTLAYTTFIDCNTKRTYCQMGKRLIHYTRANILDLGEPIENPEKWSI